MEESKKSMTVSDFIFQDLKRRIAAGEWKPGERLPSQNKLCELTGASRVSVRTAIQKLSSLGLVESKQGGGTYVCELSGAQHINSVIPYLVLSKPDRTSMMEFRRIIEVEAVALAAERASDQQIADLHTATQKMSEATAIEEIAKYDLEFHYLIVAASGNEILTKVFEVLRDTYFALLHENVIYLGSTGALYHQMITIAIESRDAELAKLLMEKHLNNTIEAMSKSTDT